jgi:hypothetical protein
MQGLQRPGRFSRRDWTIYAILVVVFAVAAVMVGYLLLPA